MGRMPDVGDVVDEVFRIEQKLDSGNFGTVYKVTDLLEKRTLALKVLRPGTHDEGELRKRFEREATLITDDFAMQNVAAAMGIAWLPVETVGIAKQLRWRWTCSGCRQKWDEPHGECPTCGSELRRTRR